MDWIASPPCCSCACWKPSHRLLRYNAARYILIYLFHSRSQRIIQIPQDVLYVLDADGEADEGGGHPARQLVFFRKLLVGGAGRGDDEAARVTPVGKVGE